MKLLMWECAGKSQAEIVEFCKKLEEYELENGVLESTKSYKERDQRASHNPTTHQPHDSGKTSRRKQKDRKRKSAQVTFPNSLRDSEKEVVNQDNICPIHRDIENPHTAANCDEIKRSRTEYVERRKKWGGSSKDKNKSNASKANGNKKRWPKSQHEVNFMVHSAMRQALENPTALGNFLAATTDLQPVHKVSKRAKLGRKGNISFLEERIIKRVLVMLVV